MQLQSVVCHGEDGDALGRRCRHSRVRILGLGMCACADVIVGNELSRCAASLAARRSACASPQVRARFDRSPLPRASICRASDRIRSSGVWFQGRCWSDRPDQGVARRRDLHGPRHLRNLPSLPLNEKRWVCSPPGRVYLRNLPDPQVPAADRPPGLGQRLGIRGAGRVQAATRGVRALVPHFHFFERCGFWCPEGKGGKVCLISWRGGRLIS